VFYSLEWLISVLEQRVADRCLRSESGQFVSFIELRGGDKCLRAESG